MTGLCFTVALVAIIGFLCWVEVERIRAIARVAALACRHDDQPDPDCRP